MTRYLTIKVPNDPEGFETEVQNCLDQGWKLHGPTQFQALLTPGGEVIEIYFQALTHAK